MLLNGQVANNALPSSEQFSLGGMLSVRGYEQSQFIADNAFCGNFELYFPGFPFLKKIEDRAQFLLFWDVGYGANYQMGSSSFAHQFLSGVGPGFRYTIPPYFSLRADYGFRLNKIPDGSAMGRFYLSAIMGY
jgi:hemolysin activation/secretion protein